MLESELQTWPFSLCASWLLACRTSQRDVLPQPASVVGCTVRTTENMFVLVCLLFKSCTCTSLLGLNSACAHACVFRCRAELQGEGAQQHSGCAGAAACRPAPLSLSVPSQRRLVQGPVQACICANAKVSGAHFTQVCGIILHWGNQIFFIAQESWFERLSNFIL